MMNFTDILEKIAETLDPEEVIDRIGISSTELCDRLADDIENKLTEFEDIYLEETDE